MIKIMYIPTGNTFTLPDEEVMKILSSDSYNYKILEGGLQKEAKGQLPPETVQELVMQKPEEVIEEEAQKEAAEDEKLDYSTLKRHELCAVASKLGVSIDAKYTKAQLLEMIYKKLGK